MNIASNPKLCPDNVLGECTRDPFPAKKVWFIKRFKIEYAFKNKILFGISWTSWLLLKIGYNRLRFDKYIKKGHFYIGLKFNLITIIGLLISPVGKSYSLYIIGINFSINILDKRSILVHNILETIPKKT
jgi:hypothetical protein